MDLWEPQGSNPLGPPGPELMSLVTTLETPNVAILVRSEGRRRRNFAIRPRWASSSSQSPEPE